MTARRWMCAAAGVSLLLAAGAAEASPWDGPWVVTLGGRVEAVTPYEGAGHDVILPVPVLNARRPDALERPSFPDDAATLTLLHFGRLSIGAAGRLRGSRDDTGYYAGLEKIGLGVEGGAAASLWVTDWLRLHAEGVKGVHGHHGWIGDFAADAVYRHGPLMLSAGPRVGFGTAKYMDTYFGVTAAEAASNPAIAHIGGTAYMPGSGRRYIGGAITGAWRWSPHWETTANLYYHRLSDLAADSPVVRALGKPNEFSGGVGLRYSFNWGG